MTTGGAALAGVPADGTAALQSVPADGTARLTAVPAYGAAADAVETGTAVLAADDTPITAVIENQTVKPGDTFTVPVLLRDNPGLVGFSFAVGYDADKLTLVSVEDGDFDGVADGVDRTANPFGLVFDTASRNNVSGGTAAVLTFQAKADAAGTTTLSLIVDESFGDGFLTFPEGAAEQERAAYTARNGVITFHSGQYEVTVDGGTGAGTYAEGASVTVTADAPASGKRFAGWDGADGLTFTTGSASTRGIVFTMPARAVTLTARYEDTPAQTYPVTVANGTGGGDYAFGETVTITANTPPVGRQFAGWDGADGLTFTNGSLSTTSASFTMPARAVEIAALFVDTPSVQTYAVTVIGGSGTGNYAQSAAVRITADADPDGRRFTGWSGAEDLTFILGSASESSAMFTMPAREVVLIAQYEGAVTPQTYTVTVNGGTGTGSYAEGASVTIAAGAAPAGQRFAGWTGADGLSFTSGNASAQTAVFTMPAWAVTVTAQYEDIPAAAYAVTVTNGTGGGSYNEGAAVAITADAAPTGQRFAGWSGTAGLTFITGDASSATAVFAMPARAVTVTAQYEAIPAETYAVTVHGGSGSGSYAAGTAVTITADAAPAGQRFAGWTGAEGLTFTSGGSLTENAVFTMPSRSVTLTAVFEDDGSGGVTYPVSVRNGSGSRNYVQGATVIIRANDPPAGQRFAGWSGADSLSFLTGGRYTMEASFAMPPWPVSVAATYETIPTERNHAAVTGGTGSGNYSVGDIVTIRAEVPDGKQFREWFGTEGLTFLEGDRTTAEAVFRMPNVPVSIDAVFEDAPAVYYRVNVTSGSGSGSYVQGAEVSISANDAPEGQRFAGWSGADGLTFTSGSAASSAAAFLMPGRAVSLTAVYEGLPAEPGTEYRTVTVTNGTGGGSYRPGDPVSITASVPAGRVFERWNGGAGLNFTSGGVTSPNSVFLMPDNNVSLTAQFSTPTTPTTPTTPSTTAGCYVATAVYGSYDCPEVWTLRRFRDQVLAKTWYGRLFIRLYYAASPTAVKLFGDSPWFRDFWRGRLDRMVDGLQADGFASTPYQDRAW